MWRDKTDHGAETRPMRGHAQQHAIEQAPSGYGQGVTAGKVCKPRPEHQRRFPRRALLMHSGRNELARERTGKVTNMSRAPMPGTAKIDSWMPCDSSRVGPSQPWAP